MSALTGQTISLTYQSLLKLEDNGPITTSLKNITDGLGNVSALQLSSTTANINGRLIASELFVNSLVDNGSGAKLQVTGNGTFYGTGNTSITSKNKVSNAIASISTNSSGTSSVYFENNDGYSYLGVNPDGNSVFGASDSISFEPFDTEAARFISGGKLLIGSTSDNGSTAKLQITGGINISGELDIRNAYSFFGTNKGYVYINQDQINSYYSNDSDAGLAINFYGYNGGTTRFRDLSIYNGKASTIATFKGSTSNLLIGSTSDNGSTAKLQVTGGITYQNIYNVQVTSYSIVLTDQGKTIQMNVGTANNLTVPLNSSVAFPIGTQIDIIQYGAGQTTIVATGGVTIRSSGGALKLFGQYSAATLQKLGTDEWLLVGDITT